MHIYGVRVGEFFWHNLSCRLRNKNCPTLYKFTHYGEKRTLKHRILYSLGVLMLDPLGRRWRHYLELALFLYNGEVRFPAEQWLHHPFPYVKRGFLRFMRKHNMRFKDKFYKENFPV